MFALAVDADMGQNGNFVRVLKLLEPYLIKKQMSDSLLGSNEIAYRAGRMIHFYVCHNEAVQVLRTEADRLFAWVHPNLPEDLSFLDADGNDWLNTVVHEKIASIRIDDEEGRSLSRKIDGLFIRGKFNEQLDDFLDDAIRHKSEWLHIAGYGIHEIPEKIGQLASLKELVIQEDGIRRLPATVFGLSQLEKLDIWTADLEPFPKELGNLVRLKHLSVNCGHYDIIGGVYTKRGVSFCELPAQIGSLTGLGHLIVTGTSLSKLPPEIAHLPNLRYVDLSYNMLEADPAELLQSPKLQFATFNGNLMP